LNAREVASKLGVSERWVRDHTTRRSPKIRAVKRSWSPAYKKTNTYEIEHYLISHFGRLRLHVPRVFAVIPQRKFPKAIFNFTEFRS
jgi:hypothetical protein